MLLRLHQGGPPFHRVDRPFIAVERRGDGRRKLAMLGLVRDLLELGSSTPRLLSEKDILDECSGSQN